MNSKKLFRPWDEKINPSLNMSTTVREESSQNMFSSSSLNPINFIKSLLISTSAHSAAQSSLTSASSSPLQYPFVTNFSTPFLWSNTPLLRNCSSSSSTSSLFSSSSSSSSILNPFEHTLLSRSTSMLTINNAKNGDNKSDVNNDNIDTDNSVSSNNHNGIYTVNANVNHDGNIKRQRPKRFRCNFCHIAFSNNGQLKGHIRTHTGERPFVCDNVNCGKTFTRNEELTRHRRIHTGLRPFRCNLCTKCFGRKDHLKKHQRTHEKRLNHLMNFTQSSNAQSSISLSSTSPRSSSIINTAFGPQKLDSFSYNIAIDQITS